MFETIHNYIEFGTNMVRKGAISAKKDEPLLIPINMRDGCILGRGKGNEDWNCSAPHGAGRIMSRSKTYLSVTGKNDSIFRLRYYTKSGGGGILIDNAILKEVFT